MRFDLKTPCRNCPFRSDETRITFSCRERAEEIEELAYRQGFPCHLSAEIDEDDEDAGFEFKDDGRTQHCIGALMVFVNDGYDSTPGTGNDEDLFEKIKEQVDWAAPVFQSLEEFFEANTGKDL